jgi:hypothetical protein
MPVGSGYEVTLRGADGSTLAHGAWSGTNKQSLSYRVWGRRTLLLRVARAGGGGRVVVRESIP